MPNSPGAPIAAGNSPFWPGPRPASFRGVRLVHRPALPSKSLEALSYDLLCAGHALSGGYDLLYMLADNTAVSLILPRLCGKRIVINTDGLEWQRSKWPWYGRLFLKFNEWLATRLTSHLVVDAREMGAYFKRRYGRETTYLTNGTDLIASRDPGLVRRLGLEPGFAAIEPGQARAFFATLREGETAPPYRMAPFRDVFIEDMLGLASALPEELRAALREELSNIWEEFRSEYEEVPPADTDMKHNPFLIIE